MRKIALLAAGAAAGLTFAGATNATEPGLPSYYGSYGNWSGLYIGGHAGAAFASADLTWSDSISGRGMALRDQGKASGDDTDFTGGVQAGYNWQSGSLVYGIEGDVSFLDPAELYSIRGRLGWALQGWMLYGTAGIGFASFDDWPDSDTLTAFVIGGGAEFQVPGWRNVTAGIEGLYYTFEDQSGSITEHIPPDFVVESRYKLEQDAFVLRGRLNYKFGP